MGHKSKTNSDQIYVCEGSAAGVDMSMLSHNLQLLFRRHKVFYTQKHLRTDIVVTMCVDSLRRKYFGLTKSGQTDFASQHMFLITRNNSHQS